MPRPCNRIPSFLKRPKTSKAFRRYQDRMKRALAVHWIIESVTQGHSQQIKQEAC
jgi:hypothetical protein